MGAVLPSKLFEIAASSDPKQALLTALGNSPDKVQVMNNQLLVATYIAPEVMRSIKRDDGTVVDLVRPDTDKTVDLYMGSIGLVIKKGPMAFKDDERLNIFWDGQDAQIGSWVLFRFSSAWETHLNGVSVRFVDDRDIKAVISDPGIIASKPIPALG